MEGWKIWRGIRRHAHRPGGPGGVRRANRWRALVVATLCAANAAQAQLETATSTIVAVSRQMGVAVQGNFTKFGAQIDFDPAKPTGGTARIVVETGSYDLGDSTYDESVRGADWFDSKAFPQATFTSTAIVPTAPNQYRVDGKLTIKGHTEAVSVPVVLTRQGAMQTFDGTLPVQRQVFNIGTGQWKDTSVVADEVLIKFHIVVAHK
ncbi:YceI family protein [Paraburkholderia acidisoli]|uniref:Polyisoprenoid-binding protein n=1 Tax=Paraburkholderia acidisoli TaxID=2571748 RepID=A0A7Z2GF39_9BURK|nr:YceI family protein [Paraburkholderia acidisoli]QGZ60632.1 polyisoprenoid-binding protein [Paraburkholderia acidisoli]